jgi:hypothetical protein
VICFIAERSCPVARYCGISAETRNILIRKKSPLLGRGTVKSDATLGYVRPGDVTNVSTAGNDALCGSALVVTSCNSR